MFAKIFKKVIISILTVSTVGCFGSIEISPSLKITGIEIKKNKSVTNKNQVKISHQNLKIDENIPNFRSKEVDLDNSLNSNNKVDLDYSDLHTEIDDIETFEDSRKYFSFYNPGNYGLDNYLMWDENFKHLRKKYLLCQWFRMMCRTSVNPIKKDTLIWILKNKDSCGYTTQYTDEMKAHIMCSKKQIIE